MWTQVSQSLHESMARVISRIATLLPGILAFIVAVLFFAAIAWLLAWVVRMFLTAIRIDERLARGTNAIAEWSPTYTPTILITRVVFWCVVLVGFLVGWKPLAHPQIICSLRVYWATFPMSWARWCCSSWATSLRAFFPAVC